MKTLSVVYCEDLGDAVNEVRTATPVRALDRLTFRELVEKHQSKVLAVSYGLLGDAALADEAAQKVFARVHRAGRAINWSSDDPTYIYQLTVDQCLAALRARRIKRRLEQLIQPLPRHDAGRSGSASAGSQQFLARALSLLSGRERALLVLREIAGLPVDDIARVMHMDNAAVKRGLLHARQELSRDLAGASKN